MIDTCTLYMLYHCLQLGSKLNMLKWAFLSENKIEIKKRGCEILTAILSLHQI